MSLIKRMGGANAATDHDTPDVPNAQMPLVVPRAAGHGAAASAGSANSNGPSTEVVLGSTATSPLPRNTVLQSRYDIEQVLGIGGMSTVYRARDLRFSTVARYCAIK